MNEFSEASPEPPRADPIACEFVTETFDYDGGRQVTVYVPPDPPEAIVFAGDGPRQRGSVGGRAAQCSCGCRDEREGRGARRRHVARGVSVDGRVGVWPVSSCELDRELEVRPQVSLPSGVSGEFTGALAP